MDEQLIITETEAPKTEVKPKVILAFYMNPDGGTFVEINTKSEAFLALALRKVGQAVDLYLVEEEMKKIQDANRIIKATIPQSVSDRLRI